MSFYSETFRGRDVSQRGGWILSTVLWVACARPPASPRVVDAGTPLAHWATGSVSRQEVEQYAKQLPPALQSQLDTDTGYRSFVSSVVDKKLLVEEARRRGLNASVDVRRQVEELEQRLEIQALLARVENEQGPPTEAELRAYYEAHRDEFGEPARAHLGRLVVQPPTPKARARLMALVARLKKEPLEAVAAAADGPERFAKGDVGWVSAPDSAEAKAGLALRTVGEVSPPIQSEQGWSVVILLERREARIPQFEEIKARVSGRIAPHRQRQAFDSLVASLRARAQVKIQAPQGK